MRKLLLATLLIALTMLTLTASFAAQAKPKEAKGKAKKARKITVTMTGRAEVPGPGDPDGQGSVIFTFDESKGEVCYEMKVSKIQTATAAHIHQGAAGKAGDVKVGLDAPANGSAKGCKSADAALITDILANPKNYYVNVHNAEFPNGAIRGQLGK